MPTWSRYFPDFPDFSLPLLVCVSMQWMNGRLGQFADMAAGIQVAEETRAALIEQIGCAMKCSDLVAECVSLLLQPFSHLSYFSGVVLCRDHKVDWDGAQVRPARACGVSALASRGERARAGQAGAQHLRAQPRHPPCGRSSHRAPLGAAPFDVPPPAQPRHSQHNHA